MKSYFGTYHPQVHAEGQEATVLVFDTKLSIGYRLPDGATHTVSWLLNKVEASFEFGRQQSRIRHTGPGDNNGELWIGGREAADHILALQAEQRLPWYRKSSGREWIRNSILFSVLAGLLVLTYLLIVPWLSEKLAAKIPVKTEQQMGDAVYSAMGMSATEDTAQSRILNEFFQAMDISTPYDIRISVIDEPVVNAFALPGGRIVVYRSLLDKIGSYAELAALLSHEFTHVNLRHSTRSISRRLGSKVFLGLLFGRFGTVSSVLVSNADNLKSLTYSRSLEKEADLEGLRLLTDRGISPQGFTDLFRHLQASASGSLLPEFLGSHPDIEKRIRYVEEASQGAPVKTNEKLATIFDQLKK